MNLQQDIYKIVEKVWIEEKTIEDATNELLQLINRIGEEVIGKDVDMSGIENSIRVAKGELGPISEAYFRRLRAEQRQRLSQLTGKVEA